MPTASIITATSSYNIAKKEKPHDLDFPTKEPTTSKDLTNFDPLLVFLAMQQTLVIVTGFVLSPFLRIFLPEN